MSSLASKTNRTSLFTTHFMAKVAILGAIAAILMLVEFPIPIAPAFYKLDFSETAVLIGGFAIGPVAAVLIEALKIFLHFLFNGTITMGIGELANFLIGCAFTVPASLFYQNHKTKKGAIIGMAIGTFCMTLIGVLLNYYMLLPAYVTIAGIPLETIINMGTAINPHIHNTFTLVIACVTPFNLIKGFAVSIITAIVYKHISPILHH